MYLYNPVPATGDNDGVAAVGGEAHARNPLRVAVILEKKGPERMHCDYACFDQSSLLKVKNQLSNNSTNCYNFCWIAHSRTRLHIYLDGVFADTKSVPQLDGPVPRTRHNLAVVSREGHTQNVLGVSDKPPGCVPTGGYKRIV